MILIPARLRSIPTHRAGLCLGAAALLALCACQDSPSGSTGPSTGDSTKANGSPTGTVDPSRTSAGDYLTFAHSDLHSLVVKADSSVWAMGSNFEGQLGDGTTEDRRSHVKTISGVRTVSASIYSSLYIKGDGSAWAAGRNLDGQLGDGTTKSRSTPVKVMDGVAAISAGYRHSLFLKPDGSAWASGSNIHGELGDPDYEEGKAPVQVPLVGIAAVAAGNFCSMFLLSNGTVYAVGSNDFGQLGNTSSRNLSRLTPVQSDVKAIALGDQVGAFLKMDGSVWVSGWEYGTSVFDDAPKPLALEKVLTDVKAIAAGKTFVLMLKNDNTLWAVNRDVIQPLTSLTSYSDPGAWQVATNVVQISAGGSLGRYLKSDGTLWEVLIAGVIDANDSVSFIRGTPERVQP